MSVRVARGFDRLAPFYDSLARLIIGKGIKQSQLHFLNHLRDKTKLLVLGGGTGWILPRSF
jgi:tRNA (cmo5U34)-methyltransferase